MQGHSTGVYKKNIIDDEVVGVVQNVIDSNNGKYDTAVKGFLLELKCHEDNYIYSY